MTGDEAWAATKRWGERLGFYGFPFGISGMATNQFALVWHLPGWLAMVVWGLTYITLVAPRVNNWSREEGGQ